MMAMIKKMLAVSGMALALLLTACGNADETISESGTAVTTSDSAGDSMDRVADASEMAEIEEVVEPGMEPVYADQLNEGVYNVTVDSSSSMFNVEQCSLVVADGTMEATMQMGGTGYEYVFMGTGEEAAAADESEYIAYAEPQEGVNAFTVPVEALDEGIPCAAFSKRKQQWYDRTILFRADSLPADAFAQGMYTTAEELGLADGEYTVEVSLSGGSGKATVTSPTKLTVADGACTAQIEWSSPHYDYMLVDGQRYDSVNTDGNSVFEIPVTGFDYRMPVVGDTTAMSEPHEIDYTLEFDSSTIQE